MLQGRKPHNRIYNISLFFHDLVSSSSSGSGLSDGLCLTLHSIRMNITSDMLNVMVFVKHADIPDNWERSRIPTSQLWLRGNSRITERSRASQPSDVCRFSRQSWVFPPAFISPVCEFSCQKFLVRNAPSLFCSQKWSEQESEGREGGCDHVPSYNTVFFFN